MSLSQEPALSALKNYFVCGTRDITNEPYAGMSGIHETSGNAVDTSNGAGPHNLQLFILSADGTVLTCLPGYWHSQDLLTEMQFAAQLNQVWLNPKLSRGQKDQMFRQMHLAHVEQHSAGMVRRSKMQGFDMQYEAKNRPNNSDTIRDHNLVLASMNNGGMKPPPSAFKTTDEIMHERMANRPFVAYNNFDVAAFSDYGKQKYDKHEDYRMADGTIDKMAARQAPTLGIPKGEERQMGRRGGRRAMMMNQQYSASTGWGNGPKWGAQ